MTTYLARTKSGKNKHFSAYTYSDAAYTYSDAYQQATDWAGDDMLESFNVTS